MRKEKKRLCNCFLSDAQYLVKRLSLFLIVIFRRLSLTGIKIVSKIFFSFLIFIIPRVL